ncbi:hypothetical protein J0H58_27035 [bacterium]|nr:hypothetical protein [bacterium]
MKAVWVAVLVLAVARLGAAAPPTHPTGKADAVPVESDLAPGAKVTLRVRQVIPADGLSRGERLLNGLPPLRAGDVFTAELVAPSSRPVLILAGCVDSVTPPGRFGRPGKVSVKLAWPLGPAGGQAGRWGFDVEDQRFTSAHRRRAITALFLAEGLALGASVGTTLDRGKAAATLGGGGVGLLLGVAYASLQPGQEGSLEPGDTLAVVVGTTAAKKLPPDAPLTVFPAHEPEGEKHRGKNP